MWLAEIQRLPDGAVGFGLIHCVEVQAGRALGEQPLAQLGGDRDPLVSHRRAVLRYRLEPARGSELSVDVWDLALLAHERAAWVEHALQPDEADLEAYLNATLATRL